MFLISFGGHPLLTFEMPITTTPSYLSQINIRRKVKKFIHHHHILLCIDFEEGFNENQCTINGLPNFSIWIYNSCNRKYFVAKTYCCTTYFPELSAFLHNLILHPNSQFGSTLEHFIIISSIENTTPWNMQIHCDTILTSSIRSAALAYHLGPKDNTASALMSSPFSLYPSGYYSDAFSQSTRQRCMFYHIALNLETDIWENGLCSGLKPLVFQQSYFS